ncbi:hypothetical protein D9M72_474120 [compost metagenome]
MQAQAATTGELARRCQVLQWQDLALHGVLQGQQPGAGEVEVVLLDGGLHLAKIQAAIGLALDRLGLDGAQHGGATALVFVGVGLLADDVLVTAFTVSHQPQQVAHGAGRYEERGLEAQALGEARFQTVDAGIFAIDIVAQLGALHGFAHAGGGLGDGVATQVDQAHSGLLGWAKSPILKLAAKGVQVQMERNAQNLFKVSRAGACL